MTKRAALRFLIQPLKLLSSALIGAFVILLLVSVMYLESRPDLQQAVVDLRNVLEQVSRYSDDILQNLDSTSRNMSEFSRQIRENPGRLIGGSAPRDTGVRRD